MDSFAQPLHIKMEDQLPELPELDLNLLTTSQEAAAAAETDPNWGEWWGEWRRGLGSPQATPVPSPPLFSPPTDHLLLPTPGLVGIKAEPGCEIALGLPSMAPLPMAGAVVDDVEWIQPVSYSQPAGFVPVGSPYLAPAGTEPAPAVTVAPAVIAAAPCPACPVRPDGVLAAADEAGPEPPSPPCNSQDAPISLPRLELEDEKADEARPAASIGVVDNPVAPPSASDQRRAARQPRKARAANQRAAKQSAKEAPVNKQRNSPRRPRSHPTVVVGRVAKPAPRKRQLAVASGARKAVPAKAAAKAAAPANESAPMRRAAAAAAPAATVSGTAGGVQKKKRASGKRRPGDKRSSRTCTGGPSGRRPGGMNVPDDQLFLYHMNLLGPGGKGRLAAEHNTRTDSLAVKVQSFLRAAVQPRLIDPTLMWQVGTAESRKPALRLNVERLKDEGVDNWAAFERRYLVVERR